KIQHLARQPLRALRPAKRLALVDRGKRLRPGHPRLELGERLDNRRIDLGALPRRRGGEREARGFDPVGNVQQQRVQDDGHAFPSTAFVYTSWTSSSPSSAPSSFCIFAESSPAISASVVGLIVTSASPALRPAFS